MNKHKQIEKMYKDLFECISYDEWSAKEYGNETVDIYSTSEKLAAKGYRKETETIAEFKKLVKEYLLDRGLYLTVIKNALKFAENKMRKEDEGK